MAWFAVEAGRIRGGVLLAICWGLSGGCQKTGAEAVRDTARGQDPSMPCGEDEVREFFCDDLLPLTSSRPAPEPFSNCPGTVDMRASAYKPIGHIAGFDPGFTEYTRKQLQLRVGAGSSETAGHSCCYSWCAKAVIADPGKAAPTQCRDAYGMRESFCMRELEGGTSEPASVPYERCPAAVQPPETAAFFAPKSALLDVDDSAKKRRETKLPECCYGWCSQTPADTVLKAHPKTK